MASQQENIVKAVSLLQGANYAVALTGAGISTPSGIPDFRSPGSGVWEKVDPFTVASLQGFRQNPQAFYDWMRPMADTFINAEPNPAHYALAKLEQYGPLKCVITQNIDLLHTRAGSQTIHEVHGHMRTASCVDCGQQVDGQTLWVDFLKTARIPTCVNCGGIQKPDVILFGEMLPFPVLYAAQKAAEACDVMLVCGSSLEVVPVADLPRVAWQSGAKLILVNLSKTYADAFADVVIRADVADVLPLLAMPFSS